MLSAHFTEVPVALVKQTHVYLLVSGDEIVYVGQSSNVTGRIGNHTTSFDFDRAFILSVSEDERLLVEGALARRFNPRHTERVSRRQQVRDSEVLARFGLVVDPVSAAAMCKRQSETVPPETRTRIAAASRHAAARRRKWKAMGVPPKMEWHARGRLFARKLLWQALEPVLRRAS